MNIDGKSPDEVVAAMDAERRAAVYWNNVLDVFGRRAPLPPDIQIVAQWKERVERNGHLQRLWNIKSNEAGYQQEVFAKLFSAVCEGTDLWIPPRYVPTIIMLHH